MGAPQQAGSAFGERLRDWRVRRRFSQLELSLAAEVSARHLSFLETGRSRPSRDMVLALADALDVPLRERNVLLTSAGFAAGFPQRPLEAPELTAVRVAVDTVLRGHLPNPALAVDGRWDLIAANGAVPLLLEGVDQELLGPPTNVYRVSLHPDGLAGRIVNFDEVAHHLLSRLRREVQISGDDGLADLLAEVERYPSVRSLPRHLDVPADVVIPLRLRHPEGELAFFTTITTFGTPVDVTVAELAIETFFPLDERTDTRLGELMPSD
ncbi:helix-turn-helix domain-containing protein [Egicoccus sp. AB-alg6-2]|uniref:helix-turn-helix domain-containing protein n=1 Tax=Egicoccus sp. AB-alg6-2 TaxID=3242692 RepID=UPI00359DEA8E